MSAHVFTEFTNTFRTNGIFHKATCNKARMAHCIDIDGSQVIISKTYWISFFENHFCLR